MYRRRWYSGEPGAVGSKGQQRRALVRLCEPGGSKTWISTAYLDPMASGTAENARGRAWIRVRTRRDDTNDGVIAYERREERARCSALGRSRARFAIRSATKYLWKVQSRGTTRSTRGGPADHNGGHTDQRNLYSPRFNYIVARSASCSTGHPPVRFHARERALRSRSGFADHYLPYLNYYFPPRAAFRNYHPAGDCQESEWAEYLLECVCSWTTYRAVASGEK